MKGGMIRACGFGGEAKGWLLSLGAFAYGLHCHSLALHATY